MIYCQTIMSRGSETIAHDERSKRNDALFPNANSDLLF